MYDELTEVDVKKMQEELEYREFTLRPKLIEDVKVARAFGDLSENFEYKAAKREKNRNDSRIRYLERMIKTAKVIKSNSKADEVGLFDSVKIYIEEDDEERDIRIVTTLRQNAPLGLISKESPVGAALMGHCVGDRVKVEVSEDYSSSKKAATTSPCPSAAIEAAASAPGLDGGHPAQPRRPGSLYSFISVDKRR